VNRRVSISWSALLVLVMIGCAASSGSFRTEGMADPCDLGTAHLLLEHVDAATWMSINNHPHDPSHDTDPDRSHVWSGLLMQIGDFDGSRWTFDSVSVYTSDLSHPDVTVGRTGPFAWINVVSERTEDYCDTPMSAEEAFDYFPWPKRISASGGIVMKVDAGVDAGALHPSLKPTGEMWRGEQLHSDMTGVHGMLTYWQGDSGFLARSTQPLFGHDRRWEFWFGDAFTVTVDTLFRNGTDDDYTDDVLVSWKEYDDATRIVVHAHDAGPSDVQTQPPPWWWP